MSAFPDRGTDGLMLPPNSVDVEQAILGGLLMEAAAFDRLDGAVTEADFYRDDHRRIFRTIGQLASTAQPVDAVTVAEAMSAEDLERVGGAAYLLTLANNTPSAVNIRRYAEIVREHAVRREIQAAANSMIEQA